MFISFEGKDGSGKSTHAEALAATLKEKGYKVELVHFPQYDKPIGKVIKEMLDGERNMPSFKAFQMLYVADQMDFQLKLQRLLDNDYIVIADRYDLSTIAYYASKFSMGAGVAFSAFTALQHGLEKPVLTFIFNSNFKDLDTRRAGMNKKRDAIENDKAIMDNINDSYLELYDVLKGYGFRDVQLIDSDCDIEHNKAIILNKVSDYV